MLRHGHLALPRGYQPACACSLLAADLLPPAGRCRRAIAALAHAAAANHRECAGTKNVRSILPDQAVAAQMVRSIDARHEGADPTTDHRSP